MRLRNVLQICLVFFGNLNLGMLINVMLIKYMYMIKISAKMSSEIGESYLKSCHYMC